MYGANSNSSGTLPFPLNIPDGMEMLAHPSLAEYSVSFTEKTTASLLSTGIFMIFIASRVIGKILR